MGLRARTAALVLLGWLGLSVGTRAAEPAVAEPMTESGAPAKLQGQVRLGCQATADGSLSDCRVISETPADQGLGAAALKLAPTLKLKPAAAGETSPRAVTIPFRFDLPNSAALASVNANVAAGGPDGLQVRQIIQPRWLAKPDGDDIARVYPERAQRLNQSGRAVVRCHITAQGKLVDCEVIQEEPLGFDFGKAALKLTPLFHLRPRTVDGIPDPTEGATITIPITFYIR